MSQSWENLTEVRLWEGLVPVETQDGNLLFKVCISTEEGAKSPPLMAPVRQGRLDTAATTMAANASSATVLSTLSDFEPFFLIESTTGEKVGGPFLIPSWRGVELARHDQGLEGLMLQTAPAGTSLATAVFRLDIEAPETQLTAAQVWLAHIAQRTCHEAGVNGEECIFRLAGERATLLLSFTKPPRALSFRDWSAEGAPDLLEALANTAACGPVRITALNAQQASWTLARPHRWIGWRRGARAGVRLLDPANSWSDLQALAPGESTRPLQVRLCGEAVDILAGFPGQQAKRIARLSESEGWHTVELKPGEEMMISDTPSALAQGDVLGRFSYVGHSLTLCVDFGASCVAAAYGVGDANPHALWLGERQYLVDHAHEEAQFSAASTLRDTGNRLISSTVALQERSSNPVGWDQASIAHVAQKIETSTGALWLEFPHPANRDVRQPVQTARDSLKIGDGSMLVPPPERSRHGLWAFEGAKQMVCNGAADENWTLPRDGQAEITFTPRQVLTASLKALMMNHVAPLLLDIVAEFEGSNREAPSFDLSRTRLVLTYPSGLPKNVQMIYRKAGEDALSALLGPTPPGEDRIQLVSEARATAFRAANAPPFVQPDARDKEETNFPAAGLNRLVVIDIGKSTADFCVAEFEAQTGDAGSCTARLDTFRTFSEFGTRLGGHKLDEALCRQLEAFILQAEPAWKPENDSVWKAHQSHVIRGAKARPSDQRSDLDGSAEIDLAVSSAENLSPLDRASTIFVPIDIIAQLFKLDPANLIMAVTSRVENTLLGSAVEVELARSDEAAGWPRLVLTNLAANGRKLSVTTGSAGWRLCLRAGYDWLHNPDTGSSSARDERQLTPRRYKRAIEAMALAAARVSSPEGSDGKASPATIWFLFTGRTSLYRSLREMNPEGDDGVSSTRALRRLRIVSQPGAGTDVAHHLKSIVVDGALMLAEWGFEKNAQPIQLSFALRHGGTELQPLSQNQVWQNVPEGAILVVAPPAGALNHEDIRAVDHDVVRPVSLETRSPIRQYRWIPEPGCWELSFNPAGATSGSAGPLRLYPHGDVARA